jgi:3-hydroxybutyryl-CoA dehydrogenase
MSSKQTVGVAGSGAMGSGIALVAATAGHPVLIFDANLQALEKAISSISDIVAKSVAKGKLGEDAGQQILSRIKTINSVGEFSPCSLIIEAIVENIEIKKSLFKSIEAVVDTSCILATNTSSLSVVSVASACQHRERVLGIHFFNPANLMPLVEIIPAFTTDENTVSQARAMIDSWGKITVLAKDTPGFIVNRIARPFYGEAIRIYEEGIADFATIDWAMKEFGGFKMGPFELMDFIGNDINYKVTETVWEQFFYDPRYRPSLTQKRLFEAGLFGRKSGRGYYNYDPDSSTPEPVKNEYLGKAIFTRVLVMLINEAADALYLKIATASDIETSMMKGVNYPKGLLRVG